MAFDAEIEDAIVEALVATNAVDAVYTTRKPMADDQSAEDLCAISILPNGWTETDLWDDTSGQLVMDETAVIVFIVRNQDPAARDLILRNLLATAQNALNGRSLGGVTLPAWTRFKSGKWIPPTSSESRISTVLHYRYLVPTWASFDTTSS